MPAERADGSDAEKVKVAQEAYHELLDGFYEEYQDMMAPQQYKAAKKDFEYLMRLVDLAITYYRDGVEGGKEGNGG